jgi:hypothetical protein
MSLTNYPIVSELLKDPQGSLDRMYNRGVEESIEAAYEAYDERGSPASEAFIVSAIIKKLQKLKQNGTSQSNPPSSV